jgi:hypothetical protein
VVPPRQNYAQDPAAAIDVSPGVECKVRGHCREHSSRCGKDIAIPSAVIPWSECLGYNSCGQSPLSALVDDSSNASGAACGDFFWAWRLRMLPFPLGGLTIPYRWERSFPFP